MEKRKKVIVAFLKKYPLVALATLNTDGYPELALVYIKIEDDLTVYFITKTKTRKLKNLLKNEYAALIASDEKNFTTVEVTGKVAIVDDIIEYAQIFDAFHTLFASRPGKKWLPPIVQIQAGKYVACKLIPEKVCHRVFSTTAHGNKHPKEFILQLRSTSPKKANL